MGELLCSAVRWRTYKKEKMKPPDRQFLSSQFHSRLNTFTHSTQQTVWCTSKISGFHFLYMFTLSKRTHQDYRWVSHTGRGSWTSSPLQDLKTCKSLSLARLCERVLAYVSTVYSILAIDLDLNMSFLHLNDVILIVKIQRCIFQADKYIPEAHAEGSL